MGINFREPKRATPDNKEARKPGILSDGSWLPGFRIKKSSRQVTRLRDGMVKSLAARSAKPRERGTMNRKEGMGFAVRQNSISPFAS
jgi:hypothetical protein